VRQKTHKDRGSIVIFVNDVTKKIRDKLLHIAQQETSQTLQQAQSYRATLNHEMRAPINSSQVVLKQIVKDLKGAGDTRSARRQIKLVITQLVFVESFIEDMLSLNLQSEGVFSLVA